MAPSVPECTSPLRACASNRDCALLFAAASAVDVESAWATVWVAARVLARCSSTSGLSHAIRRLEEQIGVRLLTRTSRSVSPTDAGEQLLAHLRPALADIRGTLTNLSGLQTRPVGRVGGHRDYVMSVLMNGLTGPLEGTTYSEVMIPMREQSDEWIASVTSYVRWAFGNYKPGVSTSDVARIRRGLASKNTMWTLADLAAALPRQIQGQEQWKLTASHHPETAGRAVSLLPWVAGAPQARGMWLQVELPVPANLTEVQFESSAGDMTAVMGASADAAAAGFTFGGLQDQARMGYPRAYDVKVSMDGSTWSAPVASGSGTGQQMAIQFAPVRAKFIRIELTDGGPAVPDWTVLKLRLFEKP